MLNLLGIGGGLAGFALLLVGAINWLHDKGPRSTPILLFFGSVLTAGTLSGYLSFVGNTSIFGLSLWTGLSVWGVQLLYYEIWKQHGLHWLRTNITAILTGISLGIGAVGFGTGGLGVVLLGMSAIWAWKERAPRLSGWAALFGGGLLSAAIVPFIAEAGSPVGKVFGGAVLLVALGGVVVFFHQIIRGGHSGGGQLARRGGGGGGRAYLRHHHRWTPVIVAATGACLIAAPLGIISGAFATATQVGTTTVAKVTGGESPAERFVQLISHQIK